MSIRVVITGLGVVAPNANTVGDFELALQGLLGDGALLSASSIQRLKAHFELEYEP